MIYKDIREKFDYIIWLRERINKLNFGISQKVKTDSTNDFALLTRKVKSYQREFQLVLDELYFLLKDEDLLAKINYLGQESGALRIRSAYLRWQKEKEEKARQKANQTRGGGRSQKQRRMQI